MKRVIYTVLLGPYDDFKCSALSAGFEHYIFTDNPAIQCEGWNVVVVKPKPDIKKHSREIKINIHKFIKADLYVYLDANYELISDLNHFVRLYFFGGFTAVKHPARSCLYKEAEQILMLEKAAENLVSKQVATYSSDGMPNNARLFACGFFIRDQSFNKFCEKWYKEVEKHCHRDQLSFAYLVWRDKPQMTVLDWHLKDSILKLNPHRNGASLVEAPKIWYFVPGCGKKDLGSAINRHCEIVPSDDDWIMIKDNDLCFLYPYINKQIEAIIAKHGDEYDLLSCYTNRLGLSHQTPYGLSDDPNILNHRALAEKHYIEHFDEVIPSDKPTAGLFMLFKKKTWKEHPFVSGLAEGDFIDYQFSNGLLQSGKKLGICAGIYAFHYYRMHQQNPRDHAHLMA